MEHSESIKELTKALSKVQGALKPAKRSGHNPFHKSHFVTMSDAIECAQSLLDANGLAVIQTADVVDGQTVLETTLSHNSGEWIRGCLPLIITKNDPQAQGSAMTYAGRYSYMKIIGIAPEDDDAESAMNRVDTKESAHEKAQEIENNPVSKAANDAPKPRCPECGITMNVSKFPPNDFYCYPCSQRRKQGR